MQTWANACAMVEAASAEFKMLMARTGADQTFNSNTLVELDRAAQICDATSVYLRHITTLLANTVNQETFKSNMWKDLLSLRDQRDLVRPPLAYTTGTGKPDGDMDPHVLSSANTTPGN